jgi:hypothetical protein
MLLLVVTFLLQEVLCFGSKILKAAPPAASTASNRIMHFTAVLTSVLSLTAVLAVLVATTLNSVQPGLNPLLHTPTPQGWASLYSLALPNSLSTTTRCGLSRDAPAALLLLPLMTAAHVP